MNKKDVDVYLLITVDTECDKGPGWIIQRPMKFSSVTEAFPKLLQPLLDEFNLKPTMLLSPEILQDDGCVEVLKQAKNCELGTHLHGEFISPEAEWDANRTKVPQLFYSKETETAKMENLTNLFKDKLGYAPLSFRAGRFGVSQHTLRILEDLNYTVDSSVSPFKTHYFQNEVAKNFWGSKLEPYNPSYKDIRKKGNATILEVPVTIIVDSLMKVPSFILSQLETKMNYRKKVLAKLGYSTRERWLRPVRSSGEELISISQNVIDLGSRRNKPIVLNMMFHSNELVVGGSPYVNNSNDLEGFIESLRKLFSYLQENYRLHGIGLSETKTLF